MNERQRAEKHLRIIHQSMERATMYRAISGPAALVGGVLCVVWAWFPRKFWTSVAGSQWGFRVVWGERAGAYSAGSYVVGDLRAELKMSDGNLLSHLRTQHDGGYLAVTAEVVDRPQTSYALTVRDAPLSRNTSSSGRNR